MVGQGMCLLELSRAVRGKVISGRAEQQYGRGR